LACCPDTALNRSTVQTVCHPLTSTHIMAWCCKDPFTKFCTNRTASWRLRYSEWCCRTFSPSEIWHCHWACDCDVLNALWSFRTLSVFTKGHSITSQDTDHFDWKLICIYNLCLISIGHFIHKDPSPVYSCWQT
jgi:hypothetical protein